MKISKFDKNVKVFRGSNEQQKRRKRPPFSGPVQAI